MAGSGADISMPRLFVGLALSDASKQGCERLVKRLQREHPGASLAVQWSRPPWLHVTVRFIGTASWADARRLEEVLDCVAAGTKPFQLVLARGGVFYSRGRPSIFCVGLPEDDGGRSEFRRLARAVDGACYSIGLQIDSRQQTPHVTLGRVQQDAAELPALEMAVRELHLSEPVLVPVQELRLLRSSPDGGPGFTTVRSWPFIAPSEPSPSPGLSSTAVGGRFDSFGGPTADVWPPPPPPTPRSVEAGGLPAAAECLAGSLAWVVRDFDATDWGPECISLQRGALVELWEHQRGWAFISPQGSSRTAGAPLGWFPRAYLVQLSCGPALDDPVVFAGLGDNAPGVTASPPSPQQPPRGLVVLADFDAGNQIDGELCLSVKRGDVALLLRPPPGFENERGWAFAKVNGHGGWLPRSYLGPAAVHTFGHRPRRSSA